MPDWEEMKNELRYRVRDPRQFTEGSFFTKEFQDNPKISAVMGRLKGETKSTIQSIRFGKPGWTLPKAKEWLAEHEEVTKKMATEVGLGFLAKASLEVQSLTFASDEFDEASVGEWLTMKSFDPQKVKKQGSRFVFQERKESDFQKGSLRDIVLRSGLVATVGLLESETRKSLQKRVPDRFALKAEDIYDLEDIDVVEITLTRSPAVGKMAEFTVMKSMEQSDSGWLTTVPIVKIDKVRKQIGGYVLVPGVPDFQGDRASMEEVEKAAHRFMRNLIDSRHKGEAGALEHQVFTGVAYPIESHIDVRGVHGVRGGWFVLTQVTDDEVWEGVLRGEIIGYSIGGSGRRKKALLEVGGNVGKSEEKESEGLLKRLVQLLKGPETQQDFQSPPESAPGAQPSVPVEENSMDTQLLKLYKTLDLAPSQVQEIVDSGVDVEKAAEGWGMFMKAIGMNMSSKGIGHTMIKIMEAVRSGEFGTYPQETGMNMGPTPVGKSVSETEDVEALRKSMKENFEMMQACAARIERLENVKGLRKSQDVVMSGNLDEVQPPPGEMSLDTAADWFEVSYAESEKLAKSIGMPSKR